MIKYFYILPLLLLLIPVTSCTDEEVYKDVTTVQETHGLMIKPDSSFIILWNADIISCQTVGSIVYEGKTIQSYQLTIEGEELDEIIPGTIVVDNSGIGKVYLIIGPSNGGKSFELKSFQSLDFKAVDISLDFLFNYDGAKIIFSSPENRAKKYSTIDGKITSNVINDDPEKYEEEINEDGETWNGFSTSTSQDQISLKFSNTLIGIRPASGSGSTLDASIEGFVNMNFGIDFFMEYNPYYLKTSDPSLLSFLQLITTKSPLELFGSTAITLGTLKELKTITYTELDYGLSFELSYTQDLDEETLFKQNLARIIQVYPVGVVPVSLISELNLEFDLKAIGELKAKYKFEQENDIVLGFDLIREGFNDKEIKWYLERKSADKNNGSLVAKIELTAGIYLVLDFEVYVAGMLGPQAKGYGFIEGGLDFWQSNSDNGWKIFIDAGVAGEASLDLSMFHFDKATWSFYQSQKIELKYPIYSCPYGVKVIEGDNQTGYAGQTLPDKIKLQVYDKWDYPLSSELPAVRVYFDGNDNPSFNGTVPQTAVSTQNGISETEWTLDNTVGSQKLLGYIKDSGGSIMSNTAIINATGIEGGSVVFNPNLTYGSVSDIEGNVYKTIQIGTQTWMAENLKTTKFNNGTLIPQTIETTMFWDLTTPSYCWYDFDESTNKNLYGALYNWYAINTGRLCPTGWHIPSEEEFDILISYLGGNTSAIDKLREAGDRLHWYEGGTNDSGFTALPAGEQGSFDTSGGFANIGCASIWWTSSENATLQPLSLFLSDIELLIAWDIRWASHSVRCIKD